MRVLIAGGGVAGAAAACLLGPECLLVERESGPHDKICGEFISAEAASYLRQLGLNLLSLGATPVHQLRLIHRGQMAAARLPFPAFGLSRRTLDAALLSRAEAMGAQVLRGASVRSIEDGVAEIPGHGRFPGHAVFLATGKHDLRGARRHLSQVPEDLVGLKMYFTLDPAQTVELSGTVEIVMLRGGYVGLQLVEAGRANLCLLLTQRRFLEAGQDWPGVQALLEAESPHLARRLRGSTRVLDRPLAIFRVPYGFVHAPRPGDPANLYRLGDQAAVIPSFTGDGVSVALHTAFAAVQSPSAAAYHARLRRDLTRQIARAAALYRISRTTPALLTTVGRLFPTSLAWAAASTRISPKTLPFWERESGRNLPNPRAPPGSARTSPASPPPAGPASRPSRPTASA